MSRSLILLVTLCCSTTFVTGCWLYGLRHRNDLSVIDGYYGFGSLIHASLTYLLWQDRTARGALLLAVTALWSIGFGQHLFRRWLREGRHGGGDVRYRSAAQALRLVRDGQPSRGYWWKSYLALAFSQAVLIALLNLPLQLAIMIGDTSLRTTDVVGLAFVALGASVEVVANRQLEIFRLADRTVPATLRSGLWAWSRHPNYFGNTVVYVGFYIVALTDRSLWWTIVSPLAIIGILRWGFLGMGTRGTDKLMLEKRAGDPEYLHYVATTSSFVPFPPSRTRRVTDTR